MPVWNAGAIERIGTTAEITRRCSRHPPAFRPGRPIDLAVEQQVLEHFQLRLLARELVDCSPSTVRSSARGAGGAVSADGCFRAATAGASLKSNSPSRFASLPTRVSSHQGHWVASPGRSSPSLTARASASRWASPRMRRVLLLLASCPRSCASARPCRADWRRCQRRSQHPAPQPDGRTEERQHPRVREFAQIDRLRQRSGFRDDYDVHACCSSRAGFRRCNPSPPPSRDITARPQNRR